MPTKANKATKGNKATATATAPKATGIQAARAAAKAITVAAVAQHATKATTATKGTAKGNGAVAAATSRFNYNQMVVANPKAPTHKGFFGLVAQLARKPIAIGALAAKVQGQVKLTSTKPAAYVCRVRTRHAFSRLGILVAAK